MSRRFGLVQQAAGSPAKQLRHDLIAQGWDGQSKVTVISDGEPALPNLVRRAVRGPVTHILDWWHISMRVKHIENAVRGLLQSKGFSGLPLLFEELCLNLGDARHQAARFSASLFTSTPSLNLIPSMTFGN